MQNKKEAKKNLPHSSFFPKNSRGQGLSTNAIILIVLGVVILVVLIIGFTMGWANIAPWLSSDNVGTISNQCQASCSTRSVYDFCTKQRELKSSDLPPADIEDGVVKKTCEELVNYKNKEDKSYGIADCPGLCPTETESCKAIAVADEVECEAIMVENDCADNVKCQWN